MKRLMLALTISTTVFAQDPVVELKKDEKAPFSGYLFSPEAEATARKDSMKADILGERSKLLEEQNELLQKKVNLWMEQADSNAQRVIEAQDDSFWKKAAFFGAGALITLGTLYVAKDFVR